MAKSTSSRSTTKKTATRTQTADTKLIRELAKILDETHLTEIEMEKGALRVRVSREPAPVMMGGGTAMPVAAPAMASAPAAAATPAQTAPIADAAPSAAENPNAVKSPMVGTAYTRPSPDAAAFVNVGDSVKEGDTIMLVEAMKTFNPITASKSGTISQVLVEDAQPVEFGEPLFILD